MTRRPGHGPQAFVELDRLAGRVAARRLRLRHQPHRAESRAAGRAHHAHGAGRLRFCRSAPLFTAPVVDARPSRFTFSLGRLVVSGHGGHGRRVPLAWRPVAHRAARREASGSRRSAISRPAASDEAPGQAMPGSRSRRGRSIFHAGQHFPDVALTDSIWRARPYLRPGPPRCPGDRQARLRPQPSNGRGR
jgi:hypothetical protein